MAGDKKVRSIDNLRMTGDQILLNLISLIKVILTSPRSKMRLIGNRFLVRERKGTRKSAAIRNQTQAGREKKLNKVKLAIPARLPDILSP